MMQSGYDVAADDHALLMRETLHRCSNDLNLVVSLLSMQGRRSANPEIREALSDATLRVVALARARSALGGARQPSLPIALRLVCDALRGQAEPAGIRVCLNVDHEVTGYGAEQIGMLALIVNELTINAIKHAFEENAGGTIRIALQAQDDGNGAILSVDDDGLPMPDALYEDGLGLMLVRRLACSINCTIVPPPPGTKRFVIKLPVRPVGVDAG